MKLYIWVVLAGLFVWVLIMVSFQASPIAHNVQSHTRVLGKRVRIYFRVSAYETMCVRLLTTSRVRQTRHLISKEDQPHVETHPMLDLSALIPKVVPETLNVSFFVCQQVQP